MCPSDSPPERHDPGHEQAVSLLAPADNPVLVEVTRGTMVESRHRGAFAVCDTEGRVLLSAGDVERTIYPRSAIKPLQALALVETGAAESFAVSDAEVALACASHDGEPLHAEAAQHWLQRIGLSVADLECGAHWPYHEPSLRTLAAHGGTPTAAHNNCSGKHSGFLSLAQHLRAPTAGYIRFEHPVQQSVLGILEMMTGLDLRDAPRGIDGCGIPQYGMPLGNLALAFARFAEPNDQPERRQAACARIRRSMAEHPVMVAGHERFCTKVIAATQGRALVKTGAEGVFAAAVPELGLGVAVKIDDGQKRASEVVMAGLLNRLGLLDEGARQVLAPLLEPPLVNRRGETVGVIRLAPEAIT
ncbi:asparaginase [Algihabitans albus]|uniref:asparaginase n=1 Tax=Algihabitans albus TaxID=2164067 RepID=UPI000E5C9467|nr:asparaginase [Algihabitans albus]